MASLVEKLGGKENIIKIAEIFYAKVLDDPQLAPFFADTNMKRQHGKMISYLRYAFGDNPHYESLSKHKAHAMAVAQGLNDAHLNLASKHLQNTLRELEIEDNLIMEVMRITANEQYELLCA